MVILKYNKILRLIEEIAPTEFNPDWDNSGPQIETGKSEISKVLVCLEINDDIIEEAKQKEADMIITHHPLIFTPFKCVSVAFPATKYILKLAEAGISVYSAHLSFDNAQEGNNMYLAKLLKLKDVVKPEEDALEDAEDDFDEEGFFYDEDVPGSIGYLPVAMTLKEVHTYVERCLNLPVNYAKIVDGGRDELKKVGFCTGAGGDFLYIAAKEDCDLFITGDVKLHEAQFAKAVGMSLIDAGHYGTEKIFTENFATQLKKLAGEELEVAEAESNTNPFEE